MIDKLQAWVDANPVKWAVIKYAFAIIIGGAIGLYVGC